MSNVANTIGPQHQLAINGLDKIKQSAKSRLQNNLLFAGNVTPKEAWFLLQEDDHSVLCDVRTSAEWNFVGVPDLSTLNKEPILLSWQIFPGMEINSDFINDFEKIVIDYSNIVVFICRSGSRSASAAEYCTAKGYANCFNLLGGFEGPPNMDNHRGNRAGWKNQALPWVQS